MLITNAVTKTIQVNGHEVVATFSNAPKLETYYRVRDILLNSAFAVADSDKNAYNGEVHLDNSTSLTKIPLSEIERSIYQ